MMSIKTCLVLLCLYAGTAFSQAGFPTPYEIKSDTAAIKLPDSSWQMLIDRTGKLTFEDVQAPANSVLFHLNDTKNTGIGFRKENHYWQRFKIKNSTGKEVKLIFFNQPISDRFELNVLRDSGRKEHLVSGFMVPWSDRDGYKGRFSVPVILLPNEMVTIYKKIKITRASEKELSVEFTFFENFIKQTYISEPWFVGDVRNWLIAGIMIFGFFFNLFFFLIDKGRLYLYLSLVLLLEGFWYMTAFNTITFRESPGFRLFFDIIITHSLFFILVALFVRDFLKTRKYYPKWDTWLLILTILMVITSILRRIYFSEWFTKDSKPVADFVVSLIFAMLMCSLLVSFLFFKKETDKLTNFSIVAAIPAFLMWGIVYFISSVALLMQNYQIFVPAWMQWFDNNELVIEMFCMAWFAILFTWILLQRYSLLRKQYTQQALEREREKAEMMNQQKELLEKQVEERTSELKKSQAQLIHAEKMASLGELTAGIAHEIQNPLNFVNNFSEVNHELIGEMEQEIQKGNMSEVSALGKLIKENQEKITHHGKRADSIVKGMLQHSHSSTGLKEPTDINVLADEYLRLAYHGLRAKDKTFNAIMKTEFDDSIGKLEIKKQDIGRVILNLITNAFYAVNDKKKQQLSGYEPTVLVKTQKAGDKIEVIVKDNGNGIPENVREKIFQPFFTTKPAGEGTGLGLSLSYEIVKSHNGELKMNTTIGEGTEFIIQLPSA